MDAKRISISVLVTVSIFTALPATAYAADASPIGEQAVSDAVERLAARYGGEHRDRIRAGVRGVASLWRESDGGQEAFTAFLEEHFLADPGAREAAFVHLEEAFESILGNLHRIHRFLREPIDLDTGPLTPLDMLLARYSPFAHLQEDFFEQDIAFFIALNFPRYSLKDKLRLGPGWSRREWAMARMGDRFTHRVPAGIFMKINQCDAECQQYVYDYNIYMGWLLTPEMEAPFSEGLRLVQHWGVRDELKARYTDPEGLPKQEMIHRVMLRVIDQTIPAQVVNHPGLWWEPKGNRLFRKEDGRFVPAEESHERDNRYERLLNVFKTYTLLDPYYPDNPTAMDRAFNLDREIPEQEMERLLVSVLASPQAKRVGALIAKRLGRPLRPFDIWYNGFKPAGEFDEAELDRLVRGKYPTAQAFESGLFEILKRYGFTPYKARFLGDRIAVDPARGSGHAMPASMRSDKVRLRTRVPAGGMNYKGFNIALHEMGHNVEEIFSLHAIDHYSLRGVPNNGFTEALAIMCQNRDLEVLGLKKPDAKSRDLQTLDTIWNTMEIGGVGLTEMRIWRWMYAHPDATPDALREAVLRIAREVWNDYFAPVFMVEDSPILAVYAHMLSNPTYLPNYAMGHIILFQIERYLEGKDFAMEVERMFRLGSLTPSQWMQEAVGADLSTRPLLEAAEEALGRLAE